MSDHLAYARDLGTWPEDSELVGIQGPLSVWEEDGKKHASARFYLIDRYLQNKT